MTSVIAAAISGITAIIVCVINNRAQMDKMIQHNKEQIDLILYRLDKLEEKQDKHNNLIERTYKLEAEVENIKQQNH